MIRRSMPFDRTPHFYFLKDLPALALWILLMFSSDALFSQATGGTTSTQFSGRATPLIGFEGALNNANGSWERK